MTKEQIKQKIANDENTGRQLFASVCQRERWCKVHKYPKTETAPWDIAFTHNGEEIIGEIKMREYSTNAFKDWFFEVSKIDGLIKTIDSVKEKTGKELRVAYINLFNNNFMCVWYFTRSQLVEKRKEAVMVTAKNNSWDKEDKIKPVVLLSYGAAQVKEEIDLNKSIFKDLKQEDNEDIKFNF